MILGKMFADGDSSHAKKPMQNRIWLPCDSQLHDMIPSSLPTKMERE